jgi:GT2 family glycosyltransferase
MIDEGASKRSSGQDLDTCCGGVVDSSLPSPLVDVIVVNWNARQQLLSCIESVQRNGDGWIGQTVVWDNGSTDGSVGTIVGIPNVTIAGHGENLGFGKACNMGAKLTSCKYLLFLNPDATIGKETLPIALAYMEHPDHHQVGICGAQLLDAAGSISRSCARFPSPLSFAAHSLGIDKFFKRTGHLMMEWDHTNTAKVDHVIGAFFLVRRAVFEALGGFDERFFLYFEDVDFSNRAHKFGWDCIFLADAQAFHAGGGTSNQIKSARLFYSLRSSLLYAFKNFSRHGAIGVFLFVAFVEPITRFVRALFQRSWPTLKETVMAYGMLWRWLPQWLWRGGTH